MSIMDKRIIMKITKEKFLELYLFNLCLFNNVKKLSNTEFKLIKLLILEGKVIDKDRKEIEEIMKLSKSSMSILLKSLVGKKYITYKVYDLNPGLTKLRDFLASNPEKVNLNYNLEFYEQHR